MQRYIKIILLIYIAISHSVFAQDQTEGVLYVKIEGIKNTTGQLNVNLFNSEEGFPGDYKKAIMMTRVRLTEGAEPVIEFTGLKSGVYGVAVIHDEDFDNTLDTGLFGIPKEGYGFSTNPKVTTHQPQFNEVKFDFDGKSREIKIMMKY